MGIRYDYFLVKFTRKEDVEFALLEGPWMIYDHYLMVKRRTSSFDPKNTSVKSAAAWVCFPYLPMEYYDESST